MGNEKKRFRDYENASEIVQTLYRENHTQQTLAYVLAQKTHHLPNGRFSGHFGTHSIDGIFDRLDDVIDDSDPDTRAVQSIHALQSAQAARRDGKPRWMQLAALIHDLGKVLCLMTDPTTGKPYQQWAVVGDTFPVGCAHDPAIIYHHFFSHNPDTRDPRLNSKYGIYQPNCGLDQVHMSWGHDEYLYHIIRPHVPPQVAYIVRYHSFYACHQQGAYQHLMNDYDHRMMAIVQEFNPYDLYSKVDDDDIDALTSPATRDYYRQLMAEFFPDTIQF